MTGEENYIACPRFGGYRTAPACIALDRYRFCRRTCKSLEQFISTHPEAVKEAEEHLHSMTNEAVKKTALFFGKSLPNSTLRCTRCGFTARSKRGLAVHTKRSHSDKARQVH